MNQGLVVQWIHERIGERNPDEARRRQPGTHGDAIREHRFDAHLVEHPRGVIRRVGAKGRRPVAIIEFFSRIDDQPGFRPLADRIRLRLEIVHRQRVILVIGLFPLRRRANGVGMVIDRLDPGDFLGELRIDPCCLR